MCPCGSDLPYDLCCGRFISGRVSPSTAEELMRSRYSAYVLGEIGWLKKTWAEEFCPTDLKNEPGIKWLGLEIKVCESLDETHATVTFVARGRSGNAGAFRMKEKSLFEKRDGRWIYVKALEGTM